MQKSVIIFGLCLLLLAIAGYMLPGQETPVTKRILLENPGGRVVFDHAVHVDNYGLDCADCHHELENIPEAEYAETFSAEQVLDCGTCHGVDFGDENEEVREAFAANHMGDFADPYACVTCHHLEFEPVEPIDWGHDMHFEDLGLDCLSCHHDTSIEDVPQNCANCHDSDPDISPSNDLESSTLINDVNQGYLSLKDAVHTRCMNCHFDKWDAGIVGCADCHVVIETSEIYADEGFYMPTDLYAKCQTCHESVPTNELIPVRMEAFHSLCMTCHEEMGGPYTQEQCNQCHLL